MKTKLASLLLLILAGCSLSPVPKTKMTMSLGGYTFDYQCPKQFSGSNLVFEVTITNGTALKASIGSINSVNDAAVIDKSYAGQAAVATAIGTQIVNGVQAGVAAAGTVAGAAAKSP